MSRKYNHRDLEFCMYIFQMLDFYFLNFYPLLMHNTVIQKMLGIELKFKGVILKKVKIFDGKSILFFVTCHRQLTFSLQFLHKDIENLYVGVITQLPTCVMLGFKSRKYRSILSHKDILDTAVPKLRESRNAAGLYKDTIPRIIYKSLQIILRTNYIFVFKKVSHISKHVLQKISIIFS